MNAQEFFDWDFESTLFPLKTNQILMRYAHAELAAHCAKILSNAPEDAAFSFLPQTRVHAAKPRNHLRRTLVLDPVSTYFLYDIVVRNCDAFPPCPTPQRKAYGYCFSAGSPEPIHKAYGDFQAAVSVSLTFSFAHSLSFDVASYFNSIYHHDFAAWFASLPGVSGADSNAFGRFFREINAGRSVDFLPQGVYPAKVLGSAFLSYVDMYGELECAELLRFMDDFYLFDEVPGVLSADFLRIQKLLGLRALNINPTKTRIDFDPSSVQAEIASLKKELQAIVGGDEVQFYPASAAGVADEEGDEHDDDWFDDDEDDVNAEEALSGEDKIQKLQELLADSRADENDVEVILSALRGHGVDLAVFVPDLMLRFPSIAKQLHAIAGHAVDKEALLAGLNQLVESDEPLIEFQLFWIAAIMEDRLFNCSGVDQAAFNVFKRSAGCKIARAKVLETPFQGSGLKEVRAEILQTAASSWESWAAAVGTRSLNKAERNHALKYFAKGSELNKLIADCIIQFG